jgi:hypothetical protein
MTRSLRDGRSLTDCWEVVSVPFSTFERGYGLWMGRGGLLARHLRWTFGLRAMTFSV